MMSVCSKLRLCSFVIHGFQGNAHCYVYNGYDDDDDDEQLVWNSRFIPSQKKPGYSIIIPNQAVLNQQQLKSAKQPIPIEFL